MEKLTRYIEGLKLKYKTYKENKKEELIIREMKSKDMELINKVKEVNLDIFKPINSLSSTLLYISITSLGEYEKLFTKIAKYKEEDFCKNIELQDELKYYLVSKTISIREFFSNAYGVSLKDPNTNLENTLNAFEVILDVYIRSTRGEGNKYKFFYRTTLDKFLNDFRTVLETIIKVNENII